MPETVYRKMLIIFFPQITRVELAALTVPCSSPSGASGSYDVAPFTSLVVCVPFTVLVAPSAPDKYSMTTAYDDQVAASVVYKVQAQTLYVDISKDYESSEAIKVGCFFVQVQQYKHEAHALS